MNERIAPIIWIAMKNMIKKAHQLVFLFEGLLEDHLFIIMGLFHVEKLSPTASPQYGHLVSFLSRALLHFGQSL